MKLENQISYPFIQQRANENLNEEKGRTDRLGLAVASRRGAEDRGIKSSLYDFP